MINLQANLITNAVGAALTIILLISNRLHARNVFFDEKLFTVMVRLNLFLCITEGFSYWVDGKLFAGAGALVRLSNVLLFMGNALFVFLWTIYADYRLFERPERLRKYYPWISIPALLVAALSAANLVTDVFFTVSPENVYSRLPLSAATYFVTYGYLLYSMVLVYCFRKKANRYLSLPVAIFLMPIFIGSLVQFFCYGLSLIWVAVAVALTSLYINIQNESSYIDPLTGLYNRQYLYRWLAHSGQGTERAAPMAGIMLDMDDFKSINDNYGHSAGDEALKDMGVLLRSVLEGGGIAVRYAGDEFMILKEMGEEELLAVMAELRMATDRFNEEGGRPYQLSFSVGGDLYRENDSNDAFFKRLDERMYTEKREKQVQV